MRETKCWLNPMVCTIGLVRLWQKESGGTCLAYVGTEPFGAIASEDKPDLQRAESPPKSKMPVTIVNDSA